MTDWLFSMPDVSTLKAFNRFVLAFWMSDQGPVDVRLPYLLCGRLGLIRRTRKCGSGCHKRTAVAYSTPTTTPVSH